jgi:hypothetical protein
MSTVAMTGDTNIVAANTYVSSALTQPVTATLPAVDDGSGATVAVGVEIRFECTGGAPILVETADGRRVGWVPGRGQAVVVAESGAQESETDLWRLWVSPQVPVAFDAAAPAGGTGATAGAYDTAANRDEAIGLINNMRQALIDFGIMKAE